MRTPRPSRGLSFEREAFSGPAAWRSVAWPSRSRALCILGAGVPVAHAGRARSPIRVSGSSRRSSIRGPLREAGAGYSRIILRWDVIQPDGPADWKPANVPDPFVTEELAAGREVVAILIGTPKWAAVHPEDGARAVPDMDAWAAFTRRMAQHYPGRIEHWIIWNEPDVWEPGIPGQTWAGTVEDYAQLLKTAYTRDQGGRSRASRFTSPASPTSGTGRTAGRQYLDRLLDVLAADPQAREPRLLLRRGRLSPLLQAAPGAQGARRGAGKPPQTRDRGQGAVGERDERATLGRQAGIALVQAALRVSLEEQAAFVLQEFSLAFAAGASRVEFYKLRNSAEHPESIEPYGLLRGDDSRRPAFAAFQVATTYLRDFRTAKREQSGAMNAVTFDRGNATTTVVWTTGTRPARVNVRAVAPDALLVNERGETKRINAKGGFYLLDLPGATCANRTECIIGGAPRLIVEAAPARGRAALAIVQKALIPPTSVPLVTGPTDWNLSLPHTSINTGPVFLGAFVTPVWGWRRKCKRHGQILALVAGGPRSAESFCWSRRSPALP